MKKSKEINHENREAKFALGLALLYMVFWYGCGLWGGQTRILGMPAWFALSCAFGPILFSLLCWLMIRRFFSEFHFEDQQ